MSTLADILTPALRMAGITKRPGIGPNTDQNAELIKAVNRMLQFWNCDGHKIFTTSIDQFELVDGQLVYTIGPGAELNVARPMYIKDANILLPTNPAIRYPVKILDSHEWSLISIQQISGGLPYALYYDSGYTAGWGRIYITMQPPEGYSLELYTWTALASAFAATTDAVVFPPGYEEAIVTNLAVKAVTLYPLESIIATNPQAMRELRQEASKALNALKTLNTICPTLRSEAEFLGRNDGWYWPGMFAGGGDGVSGDWQVISISGVVNGTTGSDGNAIFTLGNNPGSARHFALFKNGVLQIPTTAYTLSGTTVTFVAPYIPITGDTVAAMGSPS